MPEASVLKQSTRNAMLHLFDDTNEYYCCPIDDFLSSFSLPSPITKQSGVSFILISGGTLDITIGCERYQSTAGQLLIIQSSKPFSIRHYSTDVKGHFLYLKGDGVIGTMGDHSLLFNLEFLETWSNSLFEITQLPVRFIENLFKRIAWEKDHSKDVHTMVNAYVITLLLEINTIHRKAVSSNRAAIDLVRRFKKEVYRT